MGGGGSRGGGRREAIVVVAVVARCVVVAAAAPAARRPGDVTPEADFELERAAAAQGTYGARGRAEVDVDHERNGHIGAVGPLLEHRADGRLMNAQ